MTQHRLSGSPGAFDCEDTPACKEKTLNNDNIPIHIYSV